MHAMEDDHSIVAGEQRELRFTVPEPINGARLVVHYDDLGGSRFQTTAKVYFSPGSSSSDAEGNVVISNEERGWLERVAMKPVSVLESLTFPESPVRQPR